MKIKTKIKDIRKEPYETWCHYNFERYNTCPWCDGSLTLTGSVSEHQFYTCHTCKRFFELNACTEEIELLTSQCPVDAYGNKLYKVEYEATNDLSKVITGVVLVREKNSTYAKIVAHNFLLSSQNNFDNIKFTYVGEEKPMDNEENLQGIQSFQMEV